jgi:multiple sugar transport system substrate-binding protein
MSIKSVFRLTLVLVFVLPLLVACAPVAPAVPAATSAPVIQTQIVEKAVVQTQIVQVPVVQTQIVEKAAPTSGPKTVVTIAYNGYFNQTFGPADTPINVIRQEVAKKYPDIQVNLNVMPYEAGAWHDLYLAWFQGQDPTVDLIGVSGYWLPEFAQQGWLLPLNARVSKDVVASIDPADIASFTIKDNLLALGPWWGGIGGLYYRKDLLAKYNIQAPKSYDDLVAAVKKIQADNANLSGWTWPALKDQVLVNRWQEYLTGFGGQPFDASGKCAMNDAKGVAALTFMKSLFDTGITPKEALTWKEEDSVTRFASGDAIFHSGRQDLTTWLDDPKKSKIAGEWAFIPNLSQPPDGKSAGFTEYWGFGINKYSKNPDAAAKVLEVMFSFAVQKGFNLAQGPMQANMDIYKDPDVIKGNPYMSQIQEVAKTAIPPIPSAKYSTISLILQEDLSSALAGTAKVDAALNDACTRIDATK